MDDRVAPALCVLGPLEVVRDGEPVRLGSAQQRRVLAVLVVHANEVVSSDLLVDVLWGDEPPPSATHTLQTLLSRLRATLGEDRLETRAPGYRLRVATDEADALRFEELVRVGLGSADRPEVALGAFDEALGLWRGSAYAEFASEEFAAAEVARLVELRARAIEERSAALLELARPEEVIGELEAEIAAEPFRERLRALLMLALARAGRPVESLRVYDTFRRFLADEVGVVPSPGLQALNDDIVRQHPDVSWAGAPTKDRDRAGNLPRQVTTFVGREAEIASLSELVGGSSLVTLTGVGGVGKTRLAMQVAAELLPQFADGAWLCELAAAADGVLMAHTVADAIGARQRDGRSMADSVVEFLRDRELLLVFDNCEHLLGDAAELTSAILRQCPRVRVLATSREALDVMGEQVVRLGSLPIPPVVAELSVVTSSEAVRLFVDRATSARSGFTLGGANLDAVAEICRRLDGIPLAIELAAARVAAMTPADISAHLDERFRLLTGGRRSRVERHQTLRATLEWSYGLLDATERVVFDRLGVFVGSFDADAAEAVVGDDELEHWDVLDALTGLVRKSMIVADAADDGTTRYGMLETLRAFAREKLDLAGETDRWRRRHARYYAEFCERACPHLLGPDELVWVQRVDVEIDNVWAALRWGLDVAVEQEDADLALRVIIGLTIPPGLGLGRAARWGLQVWAEDFLAAARSSTLPQRAQAIALVAGLGIDGLSDLDEPEALAWEALRNRASDAPQSISLSYYTLASERYREGRPRDALEILAEGHRVLDAAGAAGASHGALHGLSSVIHAATGDFDSASREADTYIDIARATGSGLMLQAALAYAGRAWLSADPDRAARGVRGSDRHGGRHRAGHQRCDGGRGAAPRPIRRPRNRARPLASRHRVRPSQRRASKSRLHARERHRDLGTSRRRRARRDVRRHRPGRGRRDRPYTSPGRPVRGACRRADGTRRLPGRVRLRRCPLVRTGRTHPPRRTRPTPRHARLSLIPTSLGYYLTPPHTSRAWRFIGTQIVRTDRRMPLSYSAPDRHECVSLSRYAVDSLE